MITFARLVMDIAFLSEKIIVQSLSGW